MSVNTLTFDSVNITGGFWYERQKLVRETTIHAVYERFRETGRFEAFKLNWQEGMPNKPDIYWDSDVAKWIEAVAYLCQKKREPKLEAIVDEIVDDIERGRMDDGYYNSRYIRLYPEKRFTDRYEHELYCAGHLLEAAIAYDKATGKGKFLALMKDYMSLVKRLFMDERIAGFNAPGHEEIELALIKLYDYTGESCWLELAVHFVDCRGTDPLDPKYPYEAIQTQDHMSPRMMESAEGHAVRAMYLYSAMADIAIRADDSALAAICDKLFRSITETKMYITGGIGSSLTAGEAFEEEFRLPNDTAYAETCAAIGLALFCRRMSAITPDSRYADTAERIIYNGFLSGMSLDGKAFFYENPQEIDLAERKYAKNALGASNKLHFPITQRKEIFSCSCCPPNIARFIPSIGDFLYSYNDDTVYINQYMQSEARIGNTVITQSTDYPLDGKITVNLSGDSRRIALRIPEWCRTWTLTKNGAEITPAVINGYAFADLCDSDNLVINLKLEARFVRSDPHIITNRGLSALTYGPFIMCLEGVDNGGWLGNVRLSKSGVKVTLDASFGLPTVTVPAIRETPTSLYTDRVTREPFTAKLIPYFTFANRGETDMRIWVETE